LAVLHTRARRLAERKTERLAEKLGLESAAQRTAELLTEKFGLESAAQRRSELQDEKDGIECALWGAASRKIWLRATRSCQSSLPPQTNSLQTHFYGGLEGYYMECLRMAFP